MSISCTAINGYIAQEASQSKCVYSMLKDVPGLLTTLHRMVYRTRACIAV